MLWALNSAVECHPHTVEVIGSNPIAPTNNQLQMRDLPPAYVQKCPTVVIALVSRTEPRSWQSAMLHVVDLDPGKMRFGPFA
jgi:hypothetical protein